MIKGNFILLFILIGYLKITDALAEKEEMCEKSSSISRSDDLPFEMEMCILKAYNSLINLYENKPDLLVSEGKNHFIELFKKTLCCYEAHSHVIRKQENNKEEFTDQFFDKEFIRSTFFSMQAFLIGRNFKYIERFLNYCFCNLFHLICCGFFGLTRSSQVVHSPSCGLSSSSDSLKTSVVSSSNHRETSVKLEGRSKSKSKIRKSKLDIRAAKIRRGTTYGFYRKYRYAQKKNSHNLL
ncbi:hypothetical protein CAEBREN_18140 [Caenorhabditis brenneri]|uniref:Uncharacterized protein n=1 Tax=Caenorhabditis brenneri TaxID=135651 RepID=G0N033_CAEBE|nr:hypothetical protein CAEBREN_18140 [Caenorhabditis brenneri]